MSVSDAAALTTRSRSRSSKLLMIQPEEELAKHHNTHANAIRVSSHVVVANNNPRDEDFRGIMAAATSTLQHPRSSRSKTTLPADSSSIREPTTLSTPRIISYAPSCEVPTHSIDSIHSLHLHYTETQSSSSKTIPLDETHHDVKFPPLSAHAPSPHPPPLFLTKDYVAHIFCSLLILGLLILTISGDLAPPHGVIRSFKGRFANWTQVATSNQEQELREHLKLTLKVATARLEERIEGLKAEMREEMKKRKKEAEEIREEMSKEKEARDQEAIVGNKLDKKSDSHLPLATPSQWVSGTSASTVQAVPWTVPPLTPASTVQAVPWTVAVVDRPDYALASGGGHVVGHSLAYKPASSASWIESLSTLVIPPRLHPFSLIILQPSFNQPGQCLPLASSNVLVEVALRTPIFADQVTLSHVCKSIAYDISSAPKDFHIYGLPPPPLSTAKPASWILLGEFTYDIDKPLAAQTFNLSETAKKTLISTIKLHVLSNHGSASHTCIYRLQVHGGEKPQ